LITSQASGSFVFSAESSKTLVGISSISRSSSLFLVAVTKELSEMVTSSKFSGLAPNNLINVLPLHKTVFMLVPSLF